jgi:excisionase family DNA binding protein
MQGTKQIGRLFTVKETAPQMGLKESGLRALIFRGGITHYKIGKKVVISERTINEFLERALRPAKSER